MGGGHAGRQPCVDLRLRHDRRRREVPMCWGNAKIWHALTRGDRRVEIIEVLERVALSEDWRSALCADMFADDAALREELGSAGYSVSTPLPGMQALYQCAELCLCFGRCARAVGGSGG